MGRRGVHIHRKGVYAQCKVIKIAPFLSRAGYPQPPPISMPRFFCVPEARLLGKPNSKLPGTKQ
jgi:hypothetical protein